MVLIRQLLNDPQYDYIANPYPGLRAMDYLMLQLPIWVKLGCEAFNVEFDREVVIVTKAADIIPKSLRQLIEITDYADGIAKALHIPCWSLQSATPDPDETGSSTLWYDLIDLDSKRAERSLLRILDRYMEKSADPYLSIPRTALPPTPGGTQKPKVEKTKSRSRGRSKKEGSRNRPPSTSKRKISQHTHG